MWSTIERNFLDALPSRAEASFVSLRVVDSERDSVEMRQGVLEPMNRGVERGGMVTVRHQGGYGYAATSDLSLAGIKRAIDVASDWARKTRGAALLDWSSFHTPMVQERYRASVQQPWSKTTLVERIEWVRRAHDALIGDARIVDSRAGISWQSERTLQLTNDGGRVEQEFEFIAPDLGVVAHENGLTQTRSLGLVDRMRQGGLEVLQQIDFVGRACSLKEEVLELLAAPNCPSGTMDVVLMPDQMILQIHESIGHPLELDRILGDERNYAGTSFVTQDMFGSYQYGSPLLNVSFDPGVESEVASYAVDDDGTRAQKEYLIREGILVRPLGGAVSQARANMLGTANARACSWNRPPIDRMANLNLEVGEQSLEQLTSAVEKGILLKANCSWSIDDSRNKFQFGCEWGRLIENGRLTNVVRNPNYRGISATFWRNLAGVGDASTREILGTPYCGKGEPNQAIRVGHASPACRFTAVDVFGGAA
ncbi:MAG: TldD/PmbA family protein [Polyangiaceae bacterium]|nr:TldD/PmbA family protein [Polyangiaceae bacterium]